MYITGPSTLTYDEKENYYDETIEINPNKGLSAEIIYEGYPADSTQDKRNDIRSIKIAFQMDAGLDELRSSIQAKELTAGERAQVWGMLQEAKTEIADLPFKKLKAKIQEVEALLNKI